MTENKNNNAIANIPAAAPSINLSNYGFKKIVDAVSVKEQAADSIRTAIFHLVMGRTAERVSVTFDSLHYFKEEFSKFYCAKKVKVEVCSLLPDGSFGTDSCKEFNFKEYGGMPHEEYKLNINIKLLNRLLDLFLQEDIWYEDKVACGFCCHNASRNKFYKVTCE